MTSGGVRVVALGVILQVAWFTLAGAGQSLTLRLEDALVAAGLPSPLVPRALDAWVLLPVLALAAGFGRRAWRASPPARRLRRCAPLALAAVGLCAGFAMERGYLLHRFGVVREGVLYRSAQLGPASLERALQEHSIRTLVALRSAPGFLERERAAARRLGIRFEHVPMADTERGVERFLEILADPASQPVLAHCRYGIARTGVVSAVFRMEYDGWDNRRALAEARRFGGYDTLEDGSSKRRFILAYEARSRAANGPAAGAPPRPAQPPGAPAPGASGR